MTERPFSKKRSVKQIEQNLGSVLPESPKLPDQPVFVPASKRAQSQCKVFPFRIRATGSGAARASDSTCLFPEEPEPSWL